MVKLSVVVPVYNVEKYIGEMIDSLISQTLKDLEIILVDDGSPDNSGAICDQYAVRDSRIRVLHKKNGGVSAARNDGLDMATGEWIIFCDSDDWVETDAFEKMIQVGESTGADVVLGDMRLIFGEQKKNAPFFKDDFVTNDQKILDDLIRVDMCRAYCFNPPQGGPAPGYGGPWNKMVQRKILTDNGIRFDSRLKGICDDILYTAYIYAVAQKIAYSHILVYNYRQLQASITNSFKANMPEINRAIFTAWEEFLSKYGKDGRYDEAYRAFVIRRLKGLLGVYFFSSKNEKPIAEQYRELKQMLKTEPYKTAIAKANVKKLHNSYDKLIWAAAKARLPRGIRIAYTLAEYVKQKGH